MSRLRCSLPPPLPEPLVDLIAQRFGVLSHPVRLRLLERLSAAGEANVQALVDEVLTTQQNVSKHLAALHRAGLVRRRQEGRVAWYAIADETVVALIEEVGVAIAVQLRALSGNQVDGYDDGVS